MEEILFEKVASKQTNITPLTPKKLVGFYREDSLSKGILAPLIAQVAVWKSDEMCCLITIDSIGRC